jgi:choline dehydrogenase-like flavoprotein
MKSGEIIQGRHLRSHIDESYDVAVVGSGAGGAVVAGLLAEAGKRVVVLEEGPHYTPEEIAQFRPTESMRRMWREAGLQAAMGVGKTPVIGVIAGRNVGGSSVHTGGVCFRVPSEIHDEWSGRLGLKQLGEQALESAYQAVEKRVQVSETPVHLRSESTQRFVEGAAKLGIPMEPTRRNMSGCEGNARCNFGCPKQAKLSVDLSYLPGFLAKGGTVISDALVEKVVFQGTQAVGVQGHLLNGPLGAAGNLLQIRAKQVIVACGTLHTPVLLHASGIRSEHLGRHVTLHPSTRVSALFDEATKGWDGALQSVYSNHFFASDGITLVGAYSTVNILAASVPGAGPAFRRRVRDLGKLGVFGGLVHDEGGGVVKPGPFGQREPILWYRMDPRDFERVKKTISVLAEIALEAGAKEVFAPVFGLPSLKSRQEIRNFQNSPLDPRRVECVAFHPLGSARMGRSKKEGVTDEFGQVFGTQGLFVADGSVFPTSIGVNSQVPIMAMATRIAWHLSDN